MLTKNKSVRLKGCLHPRFDEILTEQALAFLEKLHHHFNERRKALLEIRAQIQKNLNKGKQLNFLSETSYIRNSDWTIAPLPKDLQDRRVEITGPVDRKIIINALNSGAKTFIADFEDATSPTWENVINGQIYLKDAIRRRIDFEASNGKQYRLNEKTAVLIVQPRGWHFEEKNITIDGKPLSASLVDFGLYFFHNARELLDRGTGPYFYLPKIENHLEARLWNDIFVYAQNELGICQGTVKATVRIETITAAFEMNEILYELQDHAAGLSCGQWDYIFSYIKKFHQRTNVILPDRSMITMKTPFMRAYSLLAIQTCHKRYAAAIGEMAAQIPNYNDDKANDDAFKKVRDDKEREAKDGFDGTCVAHPGMIHLAKEIFDQEMPTPNQIFRKRGDVEIKPHDLLEIPGGSITEQGLRTNIHIAIQYIAAWVEGKGAIPINNLMEDAASAEISRALVWQWIRHPEGILDDGREITFELVDQLREEEMLKIIQIGGIGKSQKIQQATQLFDKLVKQSDFEEFLTLPAYEKLIIGGNKYDKIQS